jgi:hypothetical protein
MANDEKIQKLIDEVKKRKKEIEGIESYTFKTNMQVSMGLDRNKVNLQVLDLHGIISVYSFLSLLAEKQLTVHKEFGITDPVTIDGFAWDKWKSDISHKINKLQINRKKKELEKLEERLNKLVSPELRAQLELQEIEKELGL